MAARIPTTRLYFEDAYLRDFTARVADLTEWQGQPAVALDATALYPEGGGQPANAGTLCGVDVVDVQERDEVIYHILNAPLPASVGDTVAGQVAWARRFDHMQQHTGQHALSGAAFRLLGADTLSWHLGADEVTIDLGLADPSGTALAEVEHAANEILWQNVPVTAKIYSPSELATLQMRRGSDREGSVRVVSVGEWDRIGCGGTHVAASGAVGAISIIRAEARGNATRVTFLCGGRALGDHRMKSALVSGLMTDLSTRAADLREHVAKLVAHGDAQRREMMDLRRAMLGYEARDLLASATDRVADRPLICQRLDGRDAESLRMLAQHIVTGGGVALVGSASDGKAYLAVACDKALPLDCGAALKAALPHIGGKGGGPKFQAQGGGPDVAGLDAALAAARGVLMGLERN